MGNVCYLHVFYSIWVLSVRKEGIYFLYGEGMSFPPTLTSGNAPGINKILPLYSCFLSTINIYPVSKSCGMLQPYHIPMCYGWEASALFSIHVSLEITVNPSGIWIYYWYTDKSLSLTGICLHWVWIAQGWRWAEVAVFSHTTAGPSAKAVCLFHDVIDIMHLYLLLVYFSGQHSS